MISSTREFVAILGFDEDVASQYDEVNGHEQTAPVEFLEREFGWMEQSGIYLESCALVDYDIQWERYITHLVQWAIEHSSPEHEGATPPSFEDWRFAENGEMT